MVIVGVIVRLRTVGVLITLGELYTSESWVGRVVDSTEVDNSTFLVGLYKKATLVSPTFFSITATETVDLSEAGKFRILAREIVTFVPGIIGSYPWTTMNG